MKWKKLCVQVILLMSLLLGAGLQQNPEVIKQVEPIQNEIIASDSYIPHGPIVIEGNEQFI